MGLVLNFRLLPKKGILTGRRKGRCGKCYKKAHGRKPEVKEHLCARKKASLEWRHEGIDGKVQGSVVATGGRLKWKRRKAQGKTKGKFKRPEDWSDRARRQQGRLKGGLNYAKVARLLENIIARRQNVRSPPDMRYEIWAFSGTPTLSLSLT